MDQVSRGVQGLGVSVLRLPKLLRKKIGKDNGQKANNYGQKTEQTE